VCRYPGINVNLSPADRPADFYRFRKIACGELVVNPGSAETYPGLERIDR